MANYNKCVKYNFRPPNGGGMYNSSAYTIFISDYAIGDDNTLTLIGNINVSDTATDIEIIIGNIFDFGIGTDIVSIISNVTTSNSCNGNDFVSYLLAEATVIDSGEGIELNKLAKINFLVTDDNILSPLDVYVLSDSRQDLFPSLKQKTAEIPGKHGEIIFDTKFGSRLMELRVASVDGLTASEKETLKRLFAKYLNPTEGSKTLTFSSDFEKMYLVKYSGKIDLNQYADWMSFTIPFKVVNPYISGSFENIQTGSGTLTNSGTLATPLVITISGPSTNPSIAIGSDTISYTGTISAGDTLTIDTENLTAELSDGTNVLHNLTSGVPDIKLQPGDTSVTADSNATITWRDRWI